MLDPTGSLADNGSTSSLSQDVKRTGQILWIRGLTRLQTQVFYLFFFLLYIILKKNSILSSLEINFLS